MVLKVPTPAVPGGAQVGNVTTAPSANTPFQSFSVPNLGEDFGKVVETDSSLTQLAGGLSDSLQKLSQKAAQDQRDAESLDLLKKQNYGDEAVRVVIDNEVSLMGENALGGTDRVEAAIDDIEKGLRADTDNLSTSGKIALEQYIRSLRSKALAAVMSHERQQRYAHTIEVVDTSIKNAIQDGVTGFMDSLELNKAQELIAQRALTRAKLTTVPGSKDARELAELLMRNSTSIMYEEAINRALAMNDLTGSTRAVELLAEAKGAGLLSADALGRAEAAVSAMRLDKVSRAEGVALFNRLPDNPTAAKEELEARDDIGGRMKDAIFDRYLKERAFAEAEEDRIYAEQYESAMINAKLGDGSVSEPVLAMMRGQDARAVRAEMDYWELDKVSGSVHTDRDAMIEWNGMLDNARALLDYDKFLTDFGNKFSHSNGDRDRAITAWRSARHSQQAAESAADQYWAKLALQDKKTLYTRVEKAFEHLLTTRTEILWERNTERNKRFRNQFIEAARLEFGERHDDDDPLNMKEMREIVDEVGARIVIGGGLSERSLHGSEVLSDVRDAKGKLVGGRAEVALAFGGVEERDRFEVLRWYRLDNNIPITEPIILKELRAWVLENVTLTRVIPPAVSESVNIGLDRLGMAINEANRQDYYRRYLINKHGGG